jgi:hypothetical protein
MFADSGGWRSPQSCRSKMWQAIGYKLRGKKRDANTLCYMASGFWQFSGVSMQRVESQRISLIMVELGQEVLSLVVMRLSCLFCYRVTWFPMGRTFNSILPGVTIRTLTFRTLHRLITAVV